MTPANNPAVKKGRPAFRLSRDQEAMAYGLVLQGVPHATIAKALGVTVNTLKKAIGPTLEEAKQQCVARVSGCLYRAALQSEAAPHGVVAAKFFLSSQAGWTDKQAMQVSGPNGGPIESRIVVELCDANNEGEIPPEAELPVPAG